jgi:transposase
MTHAEKLKRWKAALRRLNLNPREAAEKLGVHKGTGYAWNCGYTSVPEHRLKQLEDMK